MTLFWTGPPTDNRYGQLHVPIQLDLYKNAGIKGFKPTQPFNFPHVAIVQSSATGTIHFPSLSELNAELFDWHTDEEETLAADEDLMFLPLILLPSRLLPQHMRVHYPVSLTLAI